MADFDMPGIGKVRMALTQLAKEPAKNGDNGGIKRALIHELYSEIRAARMAGHSWKKIREAICQDINIRLSEPTLVLFFSEIDKEYEIKTGVKALPQRAPQKQKKKMERPRKVVREDEINV